MAVYGQTAQRLRDPTVEAEEKNADCEEFAFNHILASLCFLDIMKHRAEIRQRYGIKGSETNDCLVSCFCCACALLQQDDELKTRLASEDITTQYRPEEPMKVPGMNANVPRQWDSNVSRS
ncbi:Protein PLANT CADMIUM RESISTANCE 9 [Madurella mycetomatis]|uniref:Protein PLANT CADMIUM RESISTANCE 9 n=1 Tax=Madurella mycetomatis TaxID=100816 RepID=A0A175W851_9PEZI|nr:Protein PLANT CADMIUM RESISTANCE 9 [Madurella mycetomatis]